VLPTGAILLLYTYDPNDNLVESAMIQRAQPPQTGQRRSFRYDSLDRLTHLHVPERGAGLTDAGIPAAPPDGRWSEVLTYDQRSNLVSRTDSRGITTRYDHANDPFDRLQRISYDMSLFCEPDIPALPCPDVLYAYEQTGDLRRVRTETVAGVSTQINTYDELARLAATTISMAGLAGFPFEVAYGYDELGRLKKITYPPLYGDSHIRPELGIEIGLGHVPSKITLNDIDVPSNSSLSPVDLASGPVDLASQFAFSPAGEPTSILIGPPGPAQVTETYFYDPWHGWLLSQQLARQGALLLDLEYDYSMLLHDGAVGRSAQLTSCIDHLDAERSHSFDYDALGRLFKHSQRGSPPSWSQSYSYDPYGNRTAVTAVGHSSVADGNAATTYEDPSTNRILVPDAELCDAAGNQVAGREPGTDVHRWYQHDAAGRLAVVGDYDGSLVTTHIYGACHRRRACREGANGPITYYVWSGDQVIAEYVDYDPSGPHDLRWARNYFYFGQRVLASRRRADTGFADSALAYEHPDRVGTRFITSPEGSGDVLVLPYGAAENPTSLASHAFTTYDRDPRTQLDYAVNRFYDRGTGRFLQPDPLSEDGFDPMDPPSFNAYAYVGDDPANGTDPLGLQECPTDYCFDPSIIEFDVPTKGGQVTQILIADPSPPNRPALSGFDSLYLPRAGGGLGQGTGADPRSRGSESVRAAGNRHTEWTDWQEWDLTSAAAYSTGFADSITFGVTRWFRPEGIVNTQSPEYAIGGTTGDIWWILFPPLAGTRAAAMLSKYKWFRVLNKNRYLRFGWGKGPAPNYKWAYRMSIGPHSKGQSAFLKWIRHWRV
jgi:RHS repeat-associated protein